MKTVGIIGYGYLGRAFARFFDQHYIVRAYDPYATVDEHLKASRDQINECDMAVICVPTPMKEDGACDTSIVEDVASWLTVPLVCIKSAVRPGTSDKLNAQYGQRFCPSPEYMGESKYFTPYWKYPHPQDGRMHDFFVIGGPEPTATAITDFFLAVLGPNAKVIKMSAIEAELVKYMENSWGATKVTFMNEYYEICKAFGADFHKVREGFLADSRVERMHTMVLPDKRGFGGKCFPKDVTAMTVAATESGYEPKLLKQVLASNAEFVSSRVLHRRCEKCNVPIPADFVNNLCYAHYNELVGKPADVDIPMGKI